MQSLRIFMIFADSHLQSIHSLYLNCCEFAVTPSMLHEVKHAIAAYNREHENKLSVTTSCVLFVIVYGCVTVGSYAEIVLRNGVDKL